MRVSSSATGLKARSENSVFVPRTVRRACSPAPTRAEDVLGRIANIKGTDQSTETFNTIGNELRPERSTEFEGGFDSVLPQPHEPRLHVLLADHPGRAHRGALPPSLGSGRRPAREPRRRSRTPDSRSWSTVRSSIDAHRPRHHLTTSNANKVVTSGYAAAIGTTNARPGYPIVASGRSRLPVGRQERRRHLTYNAKIRRRTMF